MIRLNTILVATDFGDASANALSYGRELARRFGAELRLFHVVDDAATRALALQPDIMPGMTVTPKEIEAEYLGDLDKLLTDEDRRDLKAQAAVATSTNPADAIVGHAEDVGANLIVLGTHGRGPLTHMFLGNVAERVVRTAGCPVLTVKHQEHEFVLPDALQRAQPADAR